VSQQTILYRQTDPTAPERAANVLALTGGVSSVESVLQAVAEELSATLRIRDGVRTLEAQTQDEFFVRVGVSQYKARVIFVALGDDGPAQVLLTPDLLVTREHPVDSYDHVTITIGPVGQAAWALTELDAEKGRRPVGGVPIEF
jgi:hypothetical protein